MAGPFKPYRTGSGRPITALLREHGAPAVASLGRQLYREGLGILAQSQGLVPVDTAALKSSGYVTQPEKNGETIQVLIGYGGPAAKINAKTGESTDSYALYVHENLEAFHKVGSAKFLEMSFDQARTGMSARVAAGMKADLSGTTNADMPEMPEE